MKKLYLFLIFPFVMNAQNFDIEGHRGCRGLKPENTKEAFLHALSFGVNTLELDVCITKDKKVVVSHEPYMNSLFCSHPNGTPVLKKEEKELNLYQMNYEDIKKFDSGIRGNSNFPEQQKQAAYKPLLAEVFEVVENFLKANNYPLVNYNIEIKSESVEYNISQPEVAQFSDLVYSEIIKYIPANRIILQSFDFEVLKYWKIKIDSKEFEKVKLSALVEMKGVGPTFKDLGFLPDIFSPYYKLLTKGKVSKCHKKNVNVVPWTVNDIEAMKKMKAIGTDGLITDYPDRAKKLFE
jgi:glycerophosphoryl diester phosphodiesterase